jgi:Zn-finger nucleic acid-binding protein
MFLCPRCNASLGEVGPSGILEDVCSRCHYKFQVLKGRLADRASEQVVLRRETPGQRPEYRRDYELRLELPDRYEVLSLCTNGPDDQVPVRAGDIVSFVHTMKGNQLAQLVRAGGVERRPFRALGPSLRSGLCSRGGGAGAPPFGNGSVIPHERSECRDPLSRARKPATLP